MATSFRRSSCCAAHTVSGGFFRLTFYQFEDFVLHGMTWQNDQNNTFTLFILHQRETDVRCSYENQIEQVKGAMPAAYNVPKRQRGSNGGVTGQFFSGFSTIFNATAVSLGVKEKARKRFISTFAGLLAEKEDLTLATVSHTTP